MNDAVLVLNAGSSSIKFALFSAADPESAPLIKGRIGGIGRAPDFSARDADGVELAEDGLIAIDTTAGHGELTTRLLEWLDDHDNSLNLIAAGHRVVHGGQSFAAPAMITADVMSKLQKLVTLAPLHQPHNLAAVDAVSERMAGLPQVACFDTSFHRTQPRLAQLFALPRELSDQGLIRYGFHGLSYEYIASVLPDHLGDGANGRVVVAHLGNGASMCAMKERQSIATTMGYTALDGLMMGRRCGAIDPGVILHLVNGMGMSPAEVERLLYQKSGLLGVSGISNNMQVLQESAEPNAREAIDLFCYRAAGQLGMLATALGGLDAIVFTAGIGENSSTVRQRICDRLTWLGVELDVEANQTNATKISRPEAAIEVLVVATNEEQVIAKAALGLVGAPG